MTWQYIILGLLVAILAASIAVFVVLLKKPKKQAAPAQAGTRQRRRQNAYYLLGRAYQRTPLLKGQYLRIRERVMLVEPGDIVDANARTTSIMSRSLILALFVVVAALLMAGGDIYFSVAGLFVAYIIFMQSTRSRLERMELHLLLGFSDFLSDVRHYYHERKLVDDALYATLDSLPYDLSLHVRKIYDMVTSTNIKQAADQYVQDSPNRYFTTFASICASIKDYGDKKLENGSSLFLTNLNYLNEEVNMELLRRQHLSYLFKNLVPVSIFPLIFIKPIEYWAKNLMDGMENIYNGIYGLAAMLFIFVATFVCYTMICILHDDKREQVIEDSIWLKLSNRGIISTLLNKEINHHYTRALQTDMDLKAVGDQTGPKAFLLKRLAFGAAIAIAVGVLTLSFPSYQKNALRNDFSQAFSSMSVLDDNMLSLMQQVAAEKTALYEGKKELTEEEVAADIMATTDVTQQSYALIVAQAVIERVFAIAKTYYRWFYLLFVFAAFMIGFYIPKWLLKKNLEISQMSKEDEVNQFHTLMLIFMHVDRMTIATILEWMERFSYSFRASIAECRMSLNYGEQKALTALREKEKHFGPMKRFVDNLLAIDSVGIEAAFDEITTEREYYKEKRREDNMQLASHKSAKARRYAFIPLFLVIGLYLLVPMVMASVQMIVSISQAMNF